MAMSMKNILKVATVAVIAVALAKQIPVVKDYV